MLNRKAFYTAIRANPFGGELSQPQVDGIEAVLNEWERRWLSDWRFLAYMLATAFHETARTMQPIREFGKGRGKKYGTTYYGRGLVQLTWEENYRKAGRRIGVDLIRAPDFAIEMKNAVRIMFDGMLEGWFTGKKLSDYFNGEKTDWRNARRIINGTDKATMIATYAKAFYGALLKASGPDISDPPFSLPPDVERPPPGTPVDDNGYPIPLGKPLLPWWGELAVAAALIAAAIAAGHFIAGWW